MNNITERKKIENLQRESEHTYRILIENLPQKIFLKDRNSVYISCNDNYARDLKIKLQEITGKTDYDFYPKDLAEKYRTDDKRIMENGKIEDIDEEYTRDGKTFFVHTVKTPVKDTSGKVVAILGISWDITEQKRAEKSSEESETRLRIVLAAAEEGITFSDEKGRFYVYNPAMERLTGYTMEEANSYADFSRVIYPDYNKWRIAISGITELIKNGRRREVESKIVAKSGQIRDVLISSYLINYHGQKMFLSVYIDVTEHKEMERTQRLAQLGRLVADMAHEVNNPLMVISGNAQLSLMENIQNDKIKNYLKIIIEECNRAKDIIQRLLKFSRPAKGDFKDTDIHKSIDAAVELVAHQFNLSNIEIKRNYAKTLPAVFVDEKQMQEVFMNLLNNARDAMPEGGVIEIITSLERDFLRIDFKDTGHGIPEEVSKKIFEPFVTTKERGVGLGLPVCYGIIKAHNGKLEFESELQKGTTATILLPLKKG